MNEILYAQVTQTVGDRSVWDLFKVAPFTGTPTRLTFSEPGERNDSQDGAFSPDRTRIAFCTTQDRGQTANTSELYLMDADGSPRLTSNSQDDDSPRWCDDSTIVFSQAGRICEIKADESGLKAITAGPDDHWPDCSPDGTRIVFVREISGGDRQIIIMDRSGSNELILSGGTQRQ